MKGWRGHMKKPRGHVYTFDVDENFMKIAEKNIQKALLKEEDSPLIFAV